MTQNIPVILTDPINAPNIPIWIYSPEDGSVLSANPAAVELYGLNGLVSMNAANLMPPHPMSDDARPLSRRHNLPVGPRDLETLELPSMASGRRARLVMVFPNPPAAAANALLERTNRQLADENHKLRNYSFMNAHRLRSPLSTIRSIAQELSIIVRDLPTGGKTSDIQPLIGALLKSAGEADRIVSDISASLGENLKDFDYLNPVNQPLQSLALIDDDESQHMINILTIRKVLPKCPIRSYVSPVQALQEMRHNRGAVPDIIFLDLSMPEMNGWQFLDEFDPGPKKTAIYLLSASVDPRDRERAGQYPLVQGFITKPLSRDVLQQLFN